MLAWDDEESHFVEVENNNAPHSRDRCESLRPNGNTATPRTNTVVKQAVNQDINFAILQKLGDIEKLLKKIAGVEEA